MGDKPICTYYSEGYVSFHIYGLSSDVTDKSEYDKLFFEKAKEVLSYLDCDCVVYSVSYFDSNGEIFRTDYFNYNCSLSDLQKFKQKYEENSRQVKVAAVFRKQEDVNSDKTNSM